VTKPEKVDFLVFRLLTLNRKRIHWHCFVDWLPHVQLRNPPAYLPGIGSFGMDYDETAKKENWWVQFTTQPKNFIGGLDGPQRMA
jgi:hypothetical protein